MDYSVFVYILCIQYNSSDIYLRKTGTYTGNGPLQDNTIFTLQIRYIIKISTYICMVCIYVTSIYWQFSFKFISPLINWNMTIQICPISLTLTVAWILTQRKKETKKQSSQFIGTSQSSSFCFIRSPCVAVLNLNRTRKLTRKGPTTNISIRCSTIELGVSGWVVEWEWLLFPPLLFFGGLKRYYLKLSN